MVNNLPAVLRRLMLGHRLFARQLRLTNTKEAKMTPNIGTGGSAGKGGALVGGTIGWNNTVQRQRKL